MLAWRNLIRHYKKSILLGSLIMVGMLVLFLANTIFQGTNDGLERTFVGSFTGDAVISSVSSSSFSLFGNEVPIVSDYETIPPLLAHQQIIENLESIPEVKIASSIVSVRSMMTIDGRNKPVSLFGIDPGTYFEVCPDIEIVKGDVAGLSSNGVFLNSVLVEEMENLLGRTLEIGDEIIFTISSGNSFRIRSVQLLGIHEYAGSTEALDLVVLTDLTTARSLANYTLGFSAASDNIQSSDSIVDPFDLDNLFSENVDVTESHMDTFSFEEFENNLADTEERDSLVLTDSGAWSFILLKADEGMNKQMVRSLKRFLGESQTDAELLSWNEAAGSTALILFAVQSIFYIGLGFLGLGAVLVIMNALVFSVLERVGEIGTMRSMGASPGFIRKLFMLESLIITIGGSVIGVGFGSIIAIFIRLSGIQLTNPLLISLFGGSSLSPQITFISVLSHLFIALIIGSLAWVYPVSLATKVQPVSAMNKG